MHSHRKTQKEQIRGNQKMAKEQGSLKQKCENCGVEVDLNPNADQALLKADNRCGNCNHLIDFPADT